MNNLPDLKEILKNPISHNIFHGNFYSERQVIEFMKEYGRQIRDTTLKWAKNNAKIDYTYADDLMVIIDFDKASKDLEI